jgi:glycosyltransferase involved in cell wall biosynthesis
MRILHVNKFLYRRGGAEAYMLDVAELQRREGHVVELWGMDHPDNDPGLPLQDTFASYVELEPAPGGLKTLAASARMVWSGSSRRGIERALEAFRPDLVHLHNIYHQLSPSILGPIRHADIPSVMTLHDYKLACPSYQMLDHQKMCDLCVTGGTWHAAKQRCKSDSLGASAILALESGIHRALDAYSTVDVFISPSHFLHDVMARTGIDEGRLRVVPNVVQVPTLRRPAPSRSTGPATFVFAGRLSHEKGIDTLIQAVSLCRDDISVSVAGDGPERATLERMALDRAGGRVQFLGRLDKASLMSLLTRSVRSSRRAGTRTSR